MTKEEISGIMIYYYYVCKKKLWYYLHEIRMEAGNENVELGKLLDTSSYDRDNKHIMINGVINIDFLRGNHILHEIKKSKSIEEASIMQVKYYLYYLHQRGVTDISAKIDYPLLKQSITVELNDEDFPIIENVLTDIKLCSFRTSTTERRDYDMQKMCLSRPLLYLMKGDIHGRNLLYFYTWKPCQKR